MAAGVKTVVVAVSGGVDSVVLLDALVNKRLSVLAPNYQLPITNYQLVVAHIDHGIRADSGGDAEFVEQLAKKYGLDYESFKAELGVGASENDAREVRYNFLRQCSKKYKAAAVITAHHQDDVLETMVLNLLRGSGWRGLASMRQITQNKLQLTNDDFILIRPLLSASKSELLSYAEKYSLHWREDSTNEDQTYLRNYIRRTLLPNAARNDHNFSNQLLGINETVSRLRAEIEQELPKLIVVYQLPSTNSRLLKPAYQIPRYQLIMWPDDVASEVIYTVLRSLKNTWHPSQAQIESILHFVKSAQQGKQFEATKNVVVQVTLRDAQFKNTSDCGKINQ